MSLPQNTSRRLGVLAAVAVLVAAAVVVMQRLSETMVTRTITPSADAYVSSAYATENYGRAERLHADSAPQIRSYLRFDLGPTPVHVAAAVLRLKSASPHADTVQVSAVLDRSWDETGLTFQNAPRYGAPLDTPADTYDGWTSVEVTSLVQGRRVVDLVVTTTSSVALRFRSREGSDPPQLVLRLGDPPTDSPAATESPAATGGLADIVEDVEGATGKRYSTRDDTGASMDTLKIVADPRGGYLGVYHTTEPSGVLVTRVATSTDLMLWQRRAVIDEHASQATLAVLVDRSVLIAEEADTNGSPKPRTWLRLRHYVDVHALLAGQPDRTIDLPHTQVPETGAEGTPDIRSVMLRPDLDRSTVELGFHYFRDGKVDRSARGILTDFQSWSASPAPELDAAIESLDVSGNIGDRDTVVLNDQRMALVEAMDSVNGSWATYLYDETDRAARRLNIRTARRSTAFANPTVTVLRAPSGARAIVVTLFVPSSGAAHGEAGELVYFREITPRPASTDPVVAAAGDIACAVGPSPPAAGSCEADETARVVEGIDPTAVLALGDLQYVRGTLEQFLGSYDPSWGRFRGITYPVPGNHEYISPGAAGYYDYFGPAAGDRREGWYSFDLGAWHVVALNSECAEVGGCGRGSPQERWLVADLAAHPARCTLAYWHKPLFSSGAHGGATELTDIWTALHRAGADLVLNGHDHVYERFAPQDPAGRPDAQRGIRQFVVGTGGKASTEFGLPEANSETRNSGTRGVLRIELHPEGYDWRFAPVAGADFADSGSDRCH